MKKRARDALEVRLHGQRVGELRRNEDDTLEFAYDTEYANDTANPPLSTNLPIRTQAYGHHETERWFGGLLPEGDPRFELALLYNLGTPDTWTLLSRAGAECAGAVQIVDQQYHDQPSLEPVTEEEIGELLRARLRARRRALYRSARVSLAGAQPKIALYRSNDGRWAVATGGHPSTHILKPEGGRVNEMVPNEHWCMSVARETGLDVAETEVAEFAGVNTLVVKRYDRVWSKDKPPRRIHQEDLAQALGVSDEEKYQGHGGPTTSALAAVHGVDARRLFDQITFSWLIENWDAHAKNYSLLEPGTVRSRLSPGYDLMSVGCYDEEKRDRELGTEIGDTLNPDQVNAREIERLGEQIGLASEEVRQRVHTLAGRCAEAMARCATRGIESGPIRTERIAARVREVLRWWNGKPGFAPERSAAQRALTDMLETNPSEAKSPSGRGRDLPRAAVRPRTRRSNSKAQGPTKGTEKGPKSPSHGGSP